MDCKICFDRYKLASPFRPIILPQCGHTFCEACLNKLYDIKDPNNQILACPSCRTPLPSNKECLQPNYALLSLLSEDSRTSHKQIKTLWDMQKVECKKYLRESCENLNHRKVSLYQLHHNSEKFLHNLVADLGSIRASLKGIEPVLRLFQHNHFLLFSNAIDDVNSVFKNQIQYLEQQRNVLIDQLLEYQNEWSSFWDNLVKISLNHSNYIDENFDLVNRRQANENSPTMESSWMRRKRHRSDNISPSVSITYTQSIDTSEESVRDEPNDAILYAKDSSNVSNPIFNYVESDLIEDFAMKLKELSINNTNPNFIFSTPNVKKDQISFSYQSRYREILEMLFSLELDNFNPYMINQSVESNFSHNNKHYNLKTELDCMLNRLTFGLQIYNNVKELFSIFKLIGFSYPNNLASHFPSYFSNIQNSTQLMVAFPKVVPRHDNILENILSIECIKCQM